MTASSQPDRATSGAAPGAPAAPASTTASGSAPTSAPPTSAPPTSAQEPTLGKLVQDASESVSTIIRGEIELAKLELTTSAKKGGIGAGMFVAAAALLFFSLTFGLLAVAEALIAAGLPRWAGYLVVFGALLVVIAVLVLIGVQLVKRIKGPEKTIAVGQDTVAYLKSRSTSAS